ncbi:MAG: glycoside hydrolase family 5 protein [Oscillospiraceae bacterium]|nr:glycoside hydrolase family 5 protein [Oscillospiraceae bacterium]
MNKRLIFKLSAAVLSLCMLAGCTASSAETGTDTETETTQGNNAAVAQNNEMRDMTTMEIVREMELGINLGNTFESCGSWINNSSVKNYETGWGSPVITQEMIQGYKDCGFSSLRVPVAWSNMMGDNYTINADYLARVKEVVEWALDSDLYVIMNIHWDGGWFEDFGKDDKKDEAFVKYERVWTQLTEAFKDYDDKLIFESLNEEGVWDDVWNRYSNAGDKEKAYGLLNDINQKFVDIVRGSGGNNEKRHLLIAGYNTDIALTCDEAFKMPDDPQNRCALSVHYYTPSTFAILEKDESWGKARSEWGTEADFAELNKYMDMVKERFVDKGVPVIIGEYGCPTKNKEPESVRLFISSVSEAAYARGMCPMLWDITNLHYNRRSAEFVDPQLLEDIMNVKNSERE